MSTMRHVRIPSTMGEAGKRCTVMLPIWMSRLLEIFPRAARTASRKDAFCWTVKGMESEDPLMS